MDAPTVNADAYVPPAGYTKLIGRTWNLAAGQADIYRCVRFTVPEDMYITNIEAQAPIGTHHTVLTIAGSNGTSGADGEQDCSVTTIGMVMLYASGVGTSPLAFPPGVAVKVTAGQQIHLNLHLYNAGDDPLSGESAIWVKSQPTAPPDIAEMVFAGKILFFVPKMTMNHPVTNTCTVTSPFTLFALWPHMHKLAKHQKVELIRGGVTTELHNLAYNFTEQNYFLRDPLLQVQTGDQIRVTCTYDNPTSQDVYIGDSSDREMCFSGLYRYPEKNEGLFQCTDRPQGLPSI
jgi:hypothetical protein